jgi:prepilin-type N-terminal cleavage/methylation domain-containing protein
MCSHLFVSKRGVTTLELMMVVVIMGVLSALAFPDFRTFLQKHRTATQANEFVTDFNLARSEAIKRGARVTMCKSADGIDCTITGEWGQGWMVFEESIVVNALREDEEEIIKVRGGNARPAGFGETRTWPTTSPFSPQDSPEKSMERYSRGRSLWKGRGRTSGWPSTAWGGSMSRW